MRLSCHLHSVRAESREMIIVHTPTGTLDIFSSCNRIEVDIEAWET
jgi:hypothetical protein